MVHEAIAFRVGQHLQDLKSELDQLCGIEQSISSDEFISKLRHRNEPHGYQRVIFNSKDVSSKQMVYYSKHDGDEKMNGSNGDRLISSSSEGCLYSEGDRLSFQEGVIARLKRFKDPAAFVSFAAQGLMRYNHTHDIRKWYLRESASCY